MSGRRTPRTHSASLLFVFFAAILVLVMVLPAVNAGARVKITFWSWDLLADLTSSVLKRAFEAKYPAIELEVVKYGIWDVHDKLSVALAAGVGAPDVSQVTLRRFGDYKTTGKLLDLTDRFSQYEGQFGDIAWNGGKYNRRTFGVGFSTAPGIFLYRKDILDQAGVKAEDIKTWDDFIRVGKIVSDDKTDRRMTFVSANAEAFSADPWMLFLMGMGGQIFDGQGRVIRENKQAEAAFKLVHDFVFVHKIARVEPYIRPSMWTAVKGDKIASLTLAVPFIGVLKSQAPEQSGKWRVAPWPMSAGQSKRISGEFGGGILTIPKQTKHPDEAALFVEFVAATKAGQEAIFRNGQWPNYKPVLESPLMKQGEPYLGGQVLADVLSQQGSAPFNWFYWAETTEIIGAQIDAMMAGQKNPQQAWRDAEKLLAERFNK